MARSIQSPGVEIIEHDLTLSPILPAGTNIFMTGFADKGPTDEILQITSTEELEQVYGTPTNAAERYFYYGARQILNSSSGNLFISRMPYGLSAGDGYGAAYAALVYPVVAIQETNKDVCRVVSPVPASIFALNDVLTGIQSNGNLAVSAASLTANGLGYVILEIPEMNTILQSINTYYLNNVLVPANSAVAESAKSYLDNFVVDKETIVTTDLTSPNCTYVIGAPKMFDLTYDQYQSIIDGSGFKDTASVWSASSCAVNDLVSPAGFGKSGFIVVNKIQSTINNRWEGHYIGISDNTNLQPNTNHTAIRKIYTNGKSASANGLSTSTMITIPETKLAFPLSATTDSGNNRSSSSISEAFEKVGHAFPDIVTSKFDDTVSFGLFKLRISPYNPDAVKLGFAFEEARTGSFDYYRQMNNVNGGIAQTFFIENMVNSKSNNIEIMTNTYINGKNVGPWLNGEGFPKKKVRILTHVAFEELKNSQDGSYKKYGFHIHDVPNILDYIDYADALFPAGNYSTFTTTGKFIGALPLKIDRTLRKIENDELFDLDLVVEAGLGTVYSTMCANETPYFDDTESSDGLKEGLNAITNNEPSLVSKDSNDVSLNYKTIFQLFDNFCSQLRKDCLFIADPPRQIFVTGANNRVMSDHTKAFSQYIYNPLRHVFETANSSYSTTYGNWVKINDMFAGMNIWVPFSPFAAADMANVDRDFEPWYAPAGFTRGKVTNALAMAITPKQKERDMMYKIGINPVAFFPNDGFNIFGQKTLLRQPSAFDRINVRRLFLYLEKATKKTVKYFVFEPNTMFTRNRVISVLTPIFDRAKNTQGLYDYQLVCDKRNNPPAVIDQNELVIDIYLKPVRAAEFILVNFYATSTGASFSEIIGG
jgi:hypothetical protein